MYWSHIYSYSTEVVQVGCDYKKQIILNEKKMNVAVEIFNKYKFLIQADIFIIENIEIKKRQHKISIFNSVQNNNNNTN